MLYFCTLNMFEGMNIQRLRLGIDVGSTTTKVVALDGEGHVVFDKYIRHLARAVESVVDVLSDMKSKIGDAGLDRYGYSRKSQSAFCAGGRRSLQMHSDEIS